MAEAEDEDLLFGGYPASWLASGLVLGWAMLVNLVLARCFKVGQLLTFCILEQQRDISGVKDTVRNIWSNICLIGALVLTISVPLAMDTEVPKALKLQPALVSTFAMLAMLSAIQLGEVTMECIVHLIYTEALSASGTLRYLLQSQTAIGGPMLMFILGCIHCLVAMGVWAYLKYGGPVLVCGGIACLVCFLILVVIFIGANHFSPLRRALRLAPCLRVRGHWPMPMSRCLPSLQQLRARAAHRRSAREAKAKASAERERFVWRGQRLPEAAQIFRERCIAATSSRTAEVWEGEAALPLVEAAAQLVESILGGMQEQLGDLQASAEVIAVQENGHSSPGASTSLRELVELEVKFGSTSALIGEIATRSRVAVNVRVSGGLRFALQQLPQTPQQQPVVLRVEGLDMPTLPDCVCARAQLREELGDGLNPDSAYEWWEQHRHTKFPLQTSKFHRVVESLLEQRGMKMLGVQICANSFWGYLHTTDLNVEVFHFHFDKRMPGGVTLTAHLRPPKTAEEAADREQVKVITKKILQTKRASADRLAPSGINVGAMIAGPETGQPGAHPRVISKLLSAAQWWGPGDDGWHRFDETWCCTDRKDRLGRVVQQQGRIIWRREDEDGAKAKVALGRDREMANASCVAATAGAELELPDIATECGAGFSEALRLLLLLLLLCLLMHTACFKA